MSLEEGRWEGKYRQQATWLSLHMQKPHFRLCSSKATRLPSSSNTARTWQVAGRIKARISPVGRAPKMQPRLPALLCTIAAFICLGRELAYPAARARGRRFGDRIVLCFSLLHLLSQNLAIVTAFLWASPTDKSFFSFSSAGPSKIESVDISTDVVYEEEGQSVTLECKFTVSFAYYIMYWYRQSSSREMTRIIDIYSQNRQNSEGRYSVQFYKESQTLKLTISSLTLSDSDVYFCAVTEVHGDGSGRECLTKTPRAQHQTATCSRSQGENSPQNRKRVDTGMVGGSSGSREKVMNVLKTIFPHLISKKELWLQEHFHLWIWYLSTADQGVPLSFLPAQYPPPFLVTAPWFSLDKQASHPTTGFGWG